MSNSDIRLGAAAAIASMLFLGGCMFLLDTESLQEGSGGAAGQAGQGDAGGTAGSGGDDASAGTGGDGGTGGAAGTGGAGGTDGEAPRPCMSPFDCEDGDPCTVDGCDLPDGSAGPGECRRELHHGIGVEPDRVNGAPDNLAYAVQTAVDKLGLPVLVSDGDNFFLSYWYEANGSRNVVVRRYPAESALGATETLLKSAGFALTDVFSSPALVIRETSGAQRLGVMLVASNGTEGLYARTLDADTLALSTVKLFPESIFLANAADFPPPVLWAPSVLGFGTRAVAMFAYQQKLYTWVSSFSNLNVVQPELHSLPVDGVTNLRPIAGHGLTSANADYGAILETIRPGPSRAVDLWTHGNDTSLAPLDNTDGERTGLASAAVEGGFNLIAWSYSSPNGPPSLRAQAVICTSPPGPSCTPVAFESGSADSAGGMYPAIATSPITSLPGVNAVAIADVLHGKLDPSSDTIHGAVMATAMTVDTENSNAPSQINPPYIFLQGPVEPASAKPEDSPYRHTAIAVTKTGDFMAVWVERNDQGKELLMARRFGSKQCN